MRSKLHLGIGIGGVSFTNSLVSFLDTIYVQYDTNIKYALPPDTSNYSRIEQTTVVSVVNVIFIFGKVEYHLPHLH